MERRLGCGTAMVTARMDVMAPDPKGGGGVAPAGAQAHMGAALYEPSAASKTGKKGMWWVWRSFV